MPATLEEALTILDGSPDARPLGGGVAVLLRSRSGVALAPRYVAVARIPALRDRRLDPSGEIVLGGAVTLAELAGDPLVRRHLPLLAAAAGRAASPGIRSVATLAGNLVDAPATSDLAAALIAARASARLRSASDERTIPLDELCAGGAGPLEMGRGELLVEIRAPAAADAAWSLQRLQTQGAADRSAATVAIRWVVRNERVVDVGVAAAAVSARPIRLAAVERTLTGSAMADLRTGTLDAAVRAAAEVDASGSPLLEDLRGSAEYRRAMLAVLAARAVAEAAARRP